MKNLIIYSDGGSRGNPGNAAYGFLIFDAETKEILYKGKGHLGIATNNQAEYNGILHALRKAFSFSPETMICYLDSELVVKQLNGEYKVKDANIKDLYNQVMDLIIWKDVKFVHIPREKNKEADRLVNEELDRKSGARR